jgi:hypothetical protein
MGIADRVHRRQAMVLKEREAAVSTGNTQSGILVPAEPAHIKRLKGVVHVLRTYIEQNDESGGNYARLAFFMSTMTEELAEELSEYDEMKIRLFMYQIGEVISWIGHGDDSRLPEQVRDFASMIGGDNATNNETASTHIPANT